MEDGMFVVTDENGQELECVIVMTFDSDEFEKSYIVYQVKDDESGEYFAATFDPEDGEEGQLGQIETDAEWDLVEEVLENFLEEEDEDDEDEEDEEETEKN